MKNRIKRSTRVGLQFAGDRLLGESSAIGTLPGRASVAARLHKLQRARRPKAAIKCPAAVDLMHSGRVGSIGTSKVPT